MEIVNIKIDKLKPAKYNPRLDLQPEDKEYQDIKKSIVEFGLVEPLVVNKDMTVIGGHQRLKVLRDLNFTTIPCITVDLDKQKEKMLNIALNKISGDWDRVKLKDILEELDTGEFDVSLTGFGEQEIEDLMTEFHVEPEEDDFDVDKAIEEAGEPICKRGDLWQLGEHRLMCGDATVEEDVKRLMGGKKADMVFTDPPYGVDYQSNMRTKSKKFNILKNDNIILKGWIENAILFSDGWILFCTSWKILKEWMEVGKQIGDLTNMIIWDKGGGGIGDLQHSLLTDYEIILAYNRGNKIYGKRIGSVWDIGKDNPNTYEHPTQKPIELSALAIKTFSKGGIADFFGGSGSTLIACEQLNRKCYMMEIDPIYCDVIIKRWEQYTNKKAVKI